MHSTSRQGLSGIAVDLGGTKTAAARIHNGKVTAYRESPTEGGASVDLIVESMVQLIDELEIELTDKLGVAVTGRIDDSGHWYAVNQSTLTQIEKVPLRSALSKLLSRDVAVINDALAGALAEQHFGAGLHAGRMAYLTVSTGVGAGFIFDGVPFQSPRGLAGHAGFTSSRFSKARCGSGRLGTVESVASGRAIAREAAASGYPGITAENVFSAHRNGEAWATQIIQQSASAIADLCADMVAILDIDRVVMGGGVGLAEGYCEMVGESLQKMPSLFQVPVVQAGLGSESVLLGALIEA